MRNIKKIKIPPNEKLIEILSCKIKMPYSIEHLFGSDIWDYAKKQGWLEERSIIELNNIANGMCQKNICIAKFYEDLCSSLNITDSYIMFKLRDLSKMPFLKYVMQQCKSSNTVFDGFKRLLDDIEKYFV